MKEDYIEEIDNEELRLFLTKTNSKIWIESSEEEVFTDFSWVSKVEECLPYLDKIIRNPRRFLMQEEEIIAVEKSKKISTETIMHLAQNTHFIENISEDDMIQPKKVLNVTKEDTVDIYENRFIFTLLKNLTRFVDVNIEKCGNFDSYYKCNRKVSFEGETKLKHDNIKINISLENNKFQTLLAVGEESLTIEQRLKEIRLVLDGFSKTEFIRSLVSISPVRSPLRRTNLILKDPSFKKAAELWDYIEHFQVAEPKITKKTDTIADNKEIKEKYDFGYFINFDALSLLDTKYEKKKSNLYNTAYIKNLIEDYLDEVGGSERVFTSMLKEQFKVVSRQRKKREKTIKKICIKFIQKEQNNMQKVELLMK